MRKINLILFVLICLGFAAFAHAQETVNFKKFLEEKLSRMPKPVIEITKEKPPIGRKLSEFCDDKDTVAARILEDYGAIFVAENRILFPLSCMFQNDAEVSSYQMQANPKMAEIGGVLIELQEVAMNALLEAQKEAAKKNLKITPRGGSEAGKRSYQATLRLWNSRFYPALNYWVGKGKISQRDAEAARAMQPRAQVEQVLKWEEKKLWFSKDLQKSILYSVAAPGASQHIFMLALDVEQFANKQVREILADHGWFQTVKSDLPHFTYLGLKKDELQKHGLKSEPIGGQEFWIPNLD